MTQSELNREIAKATNESVRTVAAMGFTLLTPLAEEREPLVVDWDEADADRRVSLTRVSKATAAVA